MERDPFFGRTGKHGALTFVEQLLQILADVIFQAKKLEWEAKRTLRQKEKIRSHFHAPAKQNGYEH